eukprot:2721267-Rhodomonas_salina.1
MQNAGSRYTGQGSTRDHNETAHCYDKRHKSQWSGSTKKMNMGGGCGDDDGEHNDDDGDQDDYEPQDNIGKPCGGPNKPN